MSGQHTEVRVPGGKIVRNVYFYGATAANGDLTLVDNYDGTLSVSRSTNQYTFTLPFPFKKVLSAIANSGTATAFSGTRGAESGTARTVRIDFAATLNATQMNGVITVEL
jgi:hypothetical protein